MTIEQLSDCPFCQSSTGPQVREIHAFGGPRYIVVCNDCSARGPGKPKIEQAIAAWNNRPESK